MESITVYTAGYEGYDISTFIRELVVHEIDTLVDVREIPASRKRGFSKTRLKEQLAEHGIDYVHYRELGSPRELRKKLYSDGNYIYFFKEYKKYLKTRLDVLKDLYSTFISDSKCCLMCMEREHESCHRSVIAEKVKEIDGNGLVVHHI